MKNHLIKKTVTLIQKKQFIIPFVILSAVIITLSFSAGKNVNDIVINAEIKTGSMNNYMITADVIMDVNLMGSSMKYMSNTTTALKNGNYYTKVLASEPFTGAIVKTEQFIIPSGNYSCTDMYSKPLCINDNITVPVTNEISIGNNTLITYIGSKKINNINCDAILSKYNNSDILSLTSEFIDAQALSGVNDAFMYSCIDPKTGLSLESIFGMTGTASYGTYIMDVGVNVTRRMNSFTTEVPDSLFILPYEVILPEEYELLLNETMTAYNATINE